MPKQRTRFLIALVVVGVAALLGAQADAGRVAAQAATTVTVRQSATLGSYLADGAGKTLYTLSSDPANTSTCASPCTTAWPPLLLASGQPTAPAGTAGTLAVITRGDGGRQVTYNGAPLYTFVRDANPGDTNGEGVTAFGGTWHVAKVAGAAAAPPAASSAAPARAMPATGTGGSGAGRPRAVVPVFVAALVLLLGGLGLVAAQRGSRGVR
jgi:predicted lipoprotein with Yx(FWY)xxD motif